MIDDQQTYQQWKWKTLSKRRFFYHFFLESILIVNWVIVFLSTATVSQGDGDETRSERNIYSTLALTMAVIHCLLISFTYFFVMGRSMMDEFQGKRFCEFCAFSFSLVSFALMFPSQHSDSCEHQHNYIVFAISTFLFLIVFNHLGLPDEILKLTKICIIVFWIILEAYQVSIK
jgi:hypothetical protein